MSGYRMFPLLPGRGVYPEPIPWPVAEAAYKVYAERYGTGQPLERLAERGGFSACEMDDFHPGWREHADALQSPTDEPPPAWQKDEESE